MWMTGQNTDNWAINTPAPLQLTKLRNHFKTVYGFNGTQVEVMLKSSAQSLVQAIGNTHELLEKEHQQEHLVAVFHGLKGLFLNMGENEWAAFSREIEQRLKSGRGCDCSKIVTDLEDGLKDILIYGGDKTIKTAG